MTICQSCNEAICEKCVNKEFLTENNILCEKCLHPQNISQKKKRYFLSNKRLRKKSHKDNKNKEDDDNILDMDFLIENVSNKKTKNNSHNNHHINSLRRFSTDKDFKNNYNNNSQNKHKILKSKEFIINNNTRPKTKISKLKNDNEIMNNNTLSTNNNQIEKYINCYKCKKIQPINKVLTCSNKKCRESYCFLCLKSCTPGLTKTTFNYYSIHLWKCPNCSLKTKKYLNTSIENKGDEFNVLNNKKYLHKLVNTAQYCEVFFSQKYGETEHISKKCFICQNRNFSCNEMLRFSSHRDLLQYLKYTFIYQSGIMNYNNEAFEKNKHDIATYTKNVKIDYYRPWKFKYTKLVCKLCYLKLVNSHFLVNILENKFVDKIKQKKKKTLISTKLKQIKKNYINSNHTLQLDEDSNIEKEEKTEPEKKNEITNTNPPNSELINENKYDEVQCEIPLLEEPNTPTITLNNYELNDISKINELLTEILSNLFSLFQQLIQITTQFNKDTLNQYFLVDSYTCRKQLNEVIEQISDSKTKLNSILQSNYLNITNLVQQLSNQLLPFSEEEKTQLLSDLNSIIIESNQLYKIYQFLMKKIALVFYECVQSIEIHDKLNNYANLLIFTWANAAINSKKQNK